MGFTRPLDGDLEANAIASGSEAGSEAGLLTVFGLLRLATVTQIFVKQKMS